MHKYPHKNVESSKANSQWSSVCSLILFLHIHIKRDLALNLPLRSFNGNH
jgi:hypothetical protein